VIPTLPPVVAALDRALPERARPAQAPNGRALHWFIGCVFGGLSIFAPTLAQAQSGWFDASDGRLRSDLEQLVDAGVIHLPLSAWPIPIADVRAAIESRTEQDAAAVTSDGKPVEVLAPADAAALQRVSRRVAVISRNKWNSSVALTTGDSELVRDFESPLREHAALAISTSHVDEDWSATVVATAAASSADDHLLRLDGSSISWRAGNWLLAFSAADRFWGPGQESSLILSNNARPIPALVLDRATSAPFESRALHWLGRWRLTALLGQMDGHRRDVDRPLFFGLRVTWQPAPWFEFGASRTAQLCGEGRRCRLQTFVDMLSGRDNIGVGGNVAADTQPGNQLAGIDLRLASPWPSLPVAIYAQDIGEDQIHYRPTDRMHLYGIEATLRQPDGSVLKPWFEYSDSTCAASARPPFFDCAYTSNVFDADGYRYHDRSVGHSTDADSRLNAFGLRWIRADGQQWRLHLRAGDLNRGGLPDVNHSLSAVPLRYRSVDIGWRGEIARGEWSAQLGVQRRSSATLGRETDAYGAVTLRFTLR
jgi:hypothetical protein